MHLLRDSIMIDARIIEPENHPLVIAVSTRALFDLREEHSVFEALGVSEYAKLQLSRENDILKTGTAFEVIKRLLQLNIDDNKQLVEVILISRNSPDLSLRAFKSISHYGLDIRRGSFTSGRSVAPLIRAWNVDLFLSNEDSDVHSAMAAGTAAARLQLPPEETSEVPSDEVRFAFDGDAVLFDAESDQIYADLGLDAFLLHESQNAEVPMKRGPFGQFLHKLAILRKQVVRQDGSSRVRIALVTARNAPAHARVVYTFRAWGTPADEAHFVGRHEKAPILKAIGAHIFFDDQERHVLSASNVVPAGLVPGPHLPDKPIIPASY
jgi:5'-nucleotidase